MVQRASAAALMPSLLGRHVTSIARFEDFFDFERSNKNEDASEAIKMRMRAKRESEFRFFKEM